MTTRPNEREIYEAAKDAADSYALSYGEKREWADWSLSAREDFWSMGQDCYGIPHGEQTPLPDAYAEPPTGKFDTPSMWSAQRISAPDLAYTARERG